MIGLAQSNGNGGGAPITQDNIPVYVFAGVLAENTEAEYNALLNAIELTVTDTQTPVYFHFVKKAPGGTLLIFETWTWKFGKGVYPSVGAVSPIESMYLLETNYPQLGDLQPILNAGTLLDLGEITTDLITYINSQVEVDLSNVSTTYYLQYILNGVTQIYQYTGEPEIYGTSSGNTAVITDFDLIYDSNNSGTFGVNPSFQDTLDVSEIGNKVIFRNETIFDFSGGFDGTVNGILHLPDGRFFVYGVFNTYKTVPVVSPGLILFNPDFTVDTSFAPTLIAGINIATMQIVDEDRVLIGGSFSSVNGVSRNRLAVLNLADGSNDAGFVLGSGFNAPVISAVVIDEKIYLIGGFTTYKGGAVSRILSLNLDGSINARFDVGSGFAGTITSGKIIYDNEFLYIVSAFTSYDGTAANSIISLNLDGSINATFDYGTGFNFGATSIIKKDDILYVTGGFTSYDGNTANRIIALNLDGTVNNDFDSGTGFDSVTNTIFDNGSTLLVGGNVLDYNGTTIGRIIALNLDGSVDTVFNTETGFNASVNVISKINNTFLIGGAFTSFKGVAATRFVLLNETADYTNIVAEDKLTFNKNGNGIGEYHTTKTFDQLGENELVPKKLVRSTKLYKALISQSGTDDPTIIVLMNELGFEPSFTRNDAGVYTLNYNGTLEIEKTIIQYSPGIISDNYSSATYCIVDRSDDGFDLYTFGDEGSGSYVPDDSLMNYATLIIEKYN